MLTILNNFILYKSLCLFRRKRQALLCLCVGTSAGHLIMISWLAGMMRHHTWPRLSPNDDQVVGCSFWKHHYLQLPIEKSLIPLSARVIHVSLHCCCSLDLVYTCRVRAVWQLQPGPSVQRWPAQLSHVGSVTSAAAQHTNTYYTTHLNTSTHLGI